MSVLNKSNHPVLMKKVNLETWTLREEIEAKLATLIEENDEAQIEATKRFYSDLKTLEVRATEKKLQMAPELSEEDSSTEQLPQDSEVQSEDKKIDTKEDSPKIDFERVHPESELRNKGFLFLSEINMSSVIFFSKNSYKPGQNVIIEFHITRPFTMSIEVLKSVPISNKSNIISETRPGFRILADFKFYFSGERPKLRDFLKSIEPKIPPPAKKLIESLNNEASDEEDSSSIDLDDLGF